MIGNIKETFLPKTGMSKGPNSGCCMLHAICQDYMKYPLLKELKEMKNIHITLDFY